MEIGAALYILLALAVGILASREFGRSGVGWFFLALLLTPLVGLLLFLLRARRRPCPFCAELIQASATLCRFCGRPVPPASEGARLPLVTRIVLVVLIVAVLATALSQCQYRFEWWRNGRGIPVKSGQWSLVTGQWQSKMVIGNWSSVIGNWAEEGQIRFFTNHRSPMTNYQ